MTGAAELPPGLGLMLIVVGSACAYAAFFWESTKKVLSVETQGAIGRFAQSQVTWFGMLFLVRSFYRRSLNNADGRFLTRLILRPTSALSKQQTSETIWRINSRLKAQMRNDGGLRSRYI